MTTKENALSSCREQRVTLPANLVFPMARAVLGAELGSILYLGSSELANHREPSRRVISRDELCTQDIGETHWHPRGGPFQIIQFSGALGEEISPSWLVR